MQRSFLAELISRLGKKNPKFFIVIQVFSLIIGAISFGLQHTDTTHVFLPWWLQWMECNSTWVSSAVAAVVAQLPNADVHPPVK